MGQPALATIKQEQRVVVVDDDEIAIAMVRRHLRSTQCDVQGYLSARPAQQALGNRSPDVLIVDLQLPDMDGMSLIGHIFSEQSPDGCRVYLWSAAEIPKQFRGMAHDLNVGLLQKADLMDRDRFLKAVEFTA